jgi:hypothetical protein
LKLCYRLIQQSERNWRVDVFVPVQAGLQVKSAAAKL